MITLSIILARLGLCRNRSWHLCYDSGLIYSYKAEYKMSGYFVSAWSQNGNYDHEFCDTAAEARRWLIDLRKHITSE